MTQVENLEDIKIEENESAITPDSIINAFRRTTMYLTQKTGLKMMSLVQEHKDAKRVWDTMVGSDSLRLAKYFAVQLILELGWSATKAVQASPAIKSSLEKLFMINAVFLIDDYASGLFESGSMTGNHIDMALNIRNRLYDEVRDDTLVLAEGMQWDDLHLASAIGSSNSDPYENLYNWAKNFGQLNQYQDQVHPGVIHYQQRVMRHRSQKL